MKKRSKNIYKFRRGFALLILWFLLILIFAIVTTPKEKETEYIFQNLTVKSGQTLWNIAENERSKNQYYNFSESISDIVDEIRLDNELEDAGLKEGQTLKIRIKKDELSDTDQSLDNSSSNN